MKAVEKNKLDYLIDKITDYWYEYVTDNIAFLKKEVLFISEFFHLINFSIFPISIEEIEYQIANIENNDQEFLNNSIILNKKVSNTLLKYKTFKEMSEVEKKLFDLFICFFVGGVEDSELIIEYASYDLHWDLVRLIESFLTQNEQQYLEIINQCPSKEWKEVLNTRYINWKKG